MKGKRGFLWVAFTGVAVVGTIWSLSQGEMWLAILCIVLFCVGLLGILSSGTHPHPAPARSSTLPPEGRDEKSVMLHESHDSWVRPQAEGGAEPVLFIIPFVEVVLGAFSFIYLVQGAILLPIWLFGLPTNVRTMAWSPVQARVIDASGETCGKSKNGSSHRLTVTYRYQGQTYVAASRSNLNAFVPTLPPGTRLGVVSPYGAGWNLRVYHKDCGQDVKNWISYPVQQVYINPRQPNQAVVHRGVHWPQNTALSLGRGLVLLWFTLSLFSLTIGLPLKDVLFPWKVAKAFMPFTRG
ncbi:DUF3592 domain-containing protein [Deinococcus koreensis]|uniref:DUF3592 domain-containing protein n=1 Tax=Deinococcus koreensis TaxID=2054903 RepID=UPI0010572884|nr:DUF3592 domain-containing protein [Deinococcus koreensis]